MEQRFASVFELCHRANSPRLNVGAAICPAPDLFPASTCNQGGRDHADHRWIFNAGNDPELTTALTAGFNVDGIQGGGIEALERLEQL